MSAMKRCQIAVIGSGASNPGDDDYSLAIELGKELVDEGYRIVCGGLKGIMEAICKGAKSSLKYSEGMTVGVIPSLDINSSNPYVDITIASGMSVARNQIIIASSDAVIAIGGGAGTLSEIAFAWQLDKPILAFNTIDGWSKELAGRSIDSKCDEKIFSCSDISQAITRLNSILR